MLSCAASRLPKNFAASTAMCPFSGEKVESHSGSGTWLVLWGRAGLRASRRWQGRAASRQGHLLRRIVHQDARARRPVRPAVALPDQRQWRALQKKFVVAPGCLAAGAPLGRPGRPGRATRPNGLEITGPPAWPVSNQLAPRQSGGAPRPFRRTSKGCTGAGHAVRKRSLRTIGAASKTCCDPGPIAHPPARRCGPTVRVVPPALVRLPASKLTTCFGCCLARDRGLCARARRCCFKAPCPRSHCLSSHSASHSSLCGLVVCGCARRTGHRPFQHVRRYQPHGWSAHSSPRPRPRCPSPQGATRPPARASRATTLPCGTRCCRHGKSTKNVSLWIFCEAGSIVPSPVTSTRLSCISLTVMPPLECCCCRRPGHRLRAPSQSSQP